MTNSDFTIAIVDDDDTVRRALRRMISSLSYLTIEFTSGDAFLAEPNSRRFACVLMDLHMPGLNGIDVLLRMREASHTVPAIIITGGDQPKLRHRCLAAGASGYLVKPIERDAVSSAIQALASGRQNSGRI